MKSVNKTILVCAKILAALIIAGIVASAASVISGISFFVSPKAEYETVKSESFEEIRSVDISVDAAELIIRNGDLHSAETNNKNVSFSLDNGTLKIRERSTFGANKDSIIIVTLPTLAIYHEVDIDTGAGKVTIEDISAMRFSLEVGAGDVEIDKLNVYSRAEISGGAGNVKIGDGSIHNLDLELGMGNTDIIAAIFGESEIECGVGKVNLMLRGGESLYRLACYSGLGGIKVNGQSPKSGELIGHGANSIKIEGGVGAVNVGFEEMPIID